MNQETAPFYLIEPKTRKAPFVLSIPHCGTAFPSELEGNYVPELVETLDDTDWYLDKLYDFASELGITTIYAKYSRWVIDLNREPNSKPLYDDGRIITELCPTTDFQGNHIYLERDFVPDQLEKERRLETYFYPYHSKIDELLDKRRVEFGSVIFWDGHSIRREVKTIQAEPFPDFILGNNDGETANDSIINTALESLNKSDWQINHNSPFKGGFLTRSKGFPDKNLHALQLEMSKDLYMCNEESEYDVAKAENVKALLKSTFESLIVNLSNN